MANRLLASLDKAVVVRRCGCGEWRCRTYAFVERMAANVQTLAFERYAGWDAFNILHDDKAILDVEILAAENERYLRDIRVSEPLRDQSSTFLSD